MVGREQKGQLVSGVRLAVGALGARGEGLADHDGRKVFVPYVLPGEIAMAEIEGGRATCVRLLSSSLDRVAAVCPHFSICGGCAVQTLAPSAYAAWKRDLVVDALARAGVAGEVAPLVDAHGAGRRRATFHARATSDRDVLVGYMRARSHDIVAIDACPVLSPKLDGALAASRAVAGALAPARKPLDIVVTATEGGLDMDLRGYGALDDAARARLADIAVAHDLARLSNHGVIVLESRRPIVALGGARVALPPGTFLQATEAGEQALARHVVVALADARHTADLFAGIGTFALRLATVSDVTAYDVEGAALAALAQAAKTTRGLRSLAVETRDLFCRPIGREALTAFDAVVLDPPRAGAEAQMREIAASTIRRVVSVACDVTTFSRDAAILVAAGFTMGPVLPIDQFRHTPHVEVVATFEREARKPRRRLLG